MGRLFRLAHVAYALCVVLTGAMVLYIRHNMWQHW